MSKKNDEIKQYQLWVWYVNQSADKPQNGWTLRTETDSPEELFFSVAELDKGDSYYVTQSIDLRVQVI